MVLVPACLWNEARQALDAALALGASPPSKRLGTLCGAVLFATIQNDYKVASELIDGALHAATEQDDRWATAWVQSIAGELAWYRSDLPSVRAHAGESLGIFESVDDRWGMAWVLRLLGQAEGSAGNLDAAREHHLESLRLFTGLGDGWGMAWELYFLGTISRSVGDYEAADNECDHALRLFRHGGDQAGRAHVLQELAEVARLQGRLSDAGSLHEETVLLLRDIGDHHCSAASLTGLGLVAHSVGNTDAALVRLRESLKLCRDLDHKNGAAWALQALARVLADNRDAARAAEMLALVDTLRGSTRSSLTGRDKVMFDETLHDVRTMLSHDQFRAAWRRGAEKSVDDSLAQLLPESD